MVRSTVAYFMNFNWRDVINQFSSWIMKPCRLQASAYSGRVGCHGRAAQECPEICKTRLLCFRLAPSALFVISTRLWMTPPDSCDGTP